MVEATVFPVVMYGCENWMSAEELMPSKEINPEYSLEGRMLKLMLQYFAHMMRRADSLEKTLMLERLKAGGEGDNREQDDCMASPSQWT